MIFKALSTALFLFLLSAFPAMAEPITGAIALIGGILKAGGLAATLLKGVFSVALSYGVGLIKQAQARRAQKKNQRSGVTLSIQMGDTQPMSYLIGMRATAGKRKYIGSWGKSGDTPNAFVTDVIELSCLPSRNGPQGLDVMWAGEKKCTILWAEPHADGRGYPVQEFRKGSKDYLWVKYLDGTQTAADPFLVTTFGAHATRPWKTTMIGRGLQLAIVTFLYDSELFKSGMPAMVFQPKPMKLYDLRFDSTNGGSGTQRWSDPTTWTSNDNLAVMTYNVARGIYYNGEWVHGGRNFAQHRLPASSWMAAANEADRTISGRKQFRGGAEVFVDEEPLDTIEDFRVGCAGRLAEVGGVIKLLVGAPAAAVYAFTDAGVVVTSDQDFEPFPSISATHNTITGVYPEPEQRWADKDAPERSVADLVARDGGQKLSVPVRFEAVPISAQVQSLMKTMLDEEQRWRIHEFVLPPEAAALEPNDVVSWTSERQSYSAKKFIVMRSIRLRGSLYRVLLKELDPTDYDPPSIIVPVVVGYIGDTSTPVQNMTGWTAVPATVTDAAGVDRRPAIRVGCQADLTDVRAVWVQVRVKATGAVVFDSQDTPYASPYSWLISGAWTLPNVLYQAHGKFVPDSNRRTEWSDWIDVLTPNIRLGSDDVYLPDLVADLNSFLDEATRWLRDGSRELIDTARRTSLALINQDFANFSDKQMVRQELVSNTGEIRAAYTEAITVATGPNSALVQRLTKIEAAIPNLATVSVIDALTVRVDTNAAGISTLAGRATLIENELPNKASVTALSALTTTVNSHGGTLSAYGTRIDSLEAELPNKAAASAVSTLSVRVGDAETVLGTKNRVFRQSATPSATAIGDLWIRTDQNNRLYRAGAVGNANWVLSEDQRIPDLQSQMTATADALTALDATVGKFSASGKFRTTVEATPAGALARIGLSAGITAAGVTYEAAMFLDAISGGTTRVAFVADSFTITNGSATQNPFVFSGGVARLNVANIGTVNAGIVQSTNGRAVFNLTSGFLSFSDAT